MNHNTCEPQAQAQVTGIDMHRNTHRQTKENYTVDSPDDKGANDTTNNSKHNKIKTESKTR